MVRPVRSMYMDILENRALDGDTYRVTIAANEKVRQPPELEFGGLSTDNYSKNPVVMWAHDAVGRSPSGGLPIGRTLSLFKTPDGRIVADFEFLGDDPFAQRVRNAWDNGFLRAASVCWIPLESTPVSAGARKDSRSDLLEWSIVSIPADPEALRESHRCMMVALFRDDELRTADLAPEAVVQQRQCFDLGLETEVVNSENSGERASPAGALTLSVEEYNKLTRAVALLRGVVETAHTSGQAESGGTQKDTTDASCFNADFTQIQAMVERIRRLVAPT